MRTHLGQEQVATLTARFLIPMKVEAATELFIIDKPIVVLREKTVIR